VQAYFPAQDQAAPAMLRCVSTFFASWPRFGALPAPMVHFFPYEPPVHPPRPRVVRSSIIGPLPGAAAWKSTLGLEEAGDSPVAGEEKKAGAGRRRIVGMKGEPPLPSEEPEPEPEPAVAGWAPPQHCFVAPAAGATPAATYKQQALLELQRFMVDVLWRTEDPAGLEHFRGPAGAVPSVLRQTLLDCPDWAGQLLTACSSDHHRQLQEWGLRELQWYLAALHAHDDDDNRAQFWLELFVGADGVGYLMQVLGSGSVPLRDPRGLRPTALQGIQACVRRLHHAEFLEEYPLLVSTLLSQLRPVWVEEAAHGWKDLHQTLVTVLAAGGPLALIQLWTGGGVDELVELVRQVANVPEASQSADVIKLLGGILNRNDQQSSTLCDSDLLWALVDVRRRSEHVATHGNQAPAVQDRIACLTAAAAQCTVMVVRRLPVGPGVLGRVRRDSSLLTTLRWIFHSYTGPGNPWREWDHYFPGIPLLHRPRCRWLQPEPSFL
jgi:hypothetical protein